MANKEAEMSRYRMQIRIRNHVYDALVNAITLADIAAKEAKSKYIAEICQLPSSYFVVGDFSDNPVKIKSTYEYEESDGQAAQALPDVDVSCL